MEHISLVTHFAIINGVSLLMNINCDVIILVLLTRAAWGGCGRWWKPQLIDNISAKPDFDKSKNA